MKMKNLKIGALCDKRKSYITTLSQMLRASPVASKKDQHLKLYFAPKSNFLRFILKLKGCKHLKL